tara:strand:+ start:1057 stop:1935 length:879 start_codon:yes stop_codon:yes gene_type:complete
MSEKNTAANDDSPLIFVEILKEKYGKELRAVILYGSWIRGRRDTVIDFYVVLDSYKPLNSRLEASLNHLLAPNVYNMTILQGEETIATKYATVSAEVFEKSICHDFHPYFWARFAQPSEILYARNEHIRTELAELFNIATKRLITNVLPLLPKAFSSNELWEKAFELTYRCELRSESENTPKILAENMHQISNFLAKDCGLEFSDNAIYRAGNDSSRSTKILWIFRTLVGKSLSALRLFKALFTFENPLDYLVWKIERHTGIRETPTDLQRKYPILFSWTLLWKIFKRGGFR